MTIDYTTTPNYGLDKYGDKSPADLRDGHNHNMDIIDQALKNNSDAIDKKANADSVYTKQQSDALLAERDRKIQENANSINSLGQTVDSNKTAQAQKDKQQDDNASIIQSDLNVLSNTVDKNANKERADIAKVNADISDLDNRKMDKKIHRIICIGDSWGQGWHNGNDAGSSPFVNMQNVLSKYWNIQRFENVSVSASGYIPNGDSKNFIGQWNAVIDRDQITDVIVLGGQNDASANDDESDFRRAYNDFCNKIDNDTSGKAKIWNFWFPLAAGQHMTTNTSTNLHKRAVLYQALLDEDKVIKNTRTFRGCYRWGDALGDDKSLGDGAHLTPNGYGYLGQIMAKCIIDNKDFWPDRAVASTKSEVNGTWRYDEIVEKNGMITLSFCVDYTQKPSNGAIVIALPTFARSGVARFAPNFSGTVFFSMDGDAVRVQNNTDLGSSGTLACTMTFPAGY